MSVLQSRLPVPEPPNPLAALATTFAAGLISSVSLQDGRAAFQSLQKLFSGSLEVISVHSCDKKTYSRKHYQN